MFLGKILYSHSASLLSGVAITTGEFDLNVGWGEPCDGLASHPKRDFIAGSPLPPPTLRLNSPVATTPIRFMLKTQKIYFLSCFV